jgi:hypothetical protein
MWPCGCGPIRVIAPGWRSRATLARPHWGGAYNREMKDLMLRHAAGFADTVLFVVGRQS